MQKKDKYDDVISHEKSLELKKVIDLKGYDDVISHAKKFRT